MGIDVGFFYCVATDRTVDHAVDDEMPLDSLGKHEI